MTHSFVVRPLGRFGGSESPQNGLKAERRTRQAKTPQLKLDIATALPKASNGPAGVIAGL